MVCVEATAAAGIVACHGAALQRRCRIIQQSDPSTPLLGLVLADARVAQDGSRVTCHQHASAQEPCPVRLDDAVLDDGRRGLPHGDASAGLGGVVLDRAVLNLRLGGTPHGDPAACKARRVLGDQASGEGWPGLVAHVNPAAGHRGLVALHIALVQLPACVLGEDDATSVQPGGVVHEDGVLKDGRRIVCHQHSPAPLCHRVGFEGAVPELRGCRIPHKDGPSIILCLVSLEVAPQEDGPGRVRDGDAAAALCDVPVEAAVLEPWGAVALHPSAAAQGRAAVGEGQVLEGGVGQDDNRGVLAQAVDDASLFLAELATEGQRKGHRVVEPKAPTADGDDACRSGLLHGVVQARAGRADAVPGVVAGRFNPVDHLLGLRSVGVGVCAVRVRGEPQGQGGLELPCQGSSQQHRSHRWEGS
mmetsp:Transcript_104846/g.313236  ORF Transcript_104846/g.313236 Transcript_104846/m.313236 type:complete len:417 (-) Transcript_104846:33-1283(-)